VTVVHAAPPVTTDHLLAALLVGVRDGREGSFEELHARTRGRVDSLVLRLVRSPELALEVTQETYLDVWQQAGRYSPDRGSVLSWMLVIARRRAIDRIRSVTRGVALEHRVSTGADRYQDDLAEQVVARLDAARLGPMLAVLSPLQREALTLVYLHRLTSVEAAGRLAVPVSTLKTRVRDGLRQLRRRADAAHLGGPAELVGPTASGCA